jgi:hypothetical protein
MSKGGIKNLKGTTELNLSSETVRVPGGNMPLVHRPPGAASIFLILPRSVTRSRQRAVPVDWLPQRWVGRSPFAPAFRQGIA